MALTRAAARAAIHSPPTMPQRSGRRVSAGGLGEADDYPCQHAERTGKLHDGDVAGSDHRDSDQGRNGD